MPTSFMTIVVMSGFCSNRITITFLEYLILAFFKKNVIGVLTYPNLNYKGIYL